MITTHDTERDHGTDIRVATAHRHPQITHARATSCGMCTSEAVLMDMDRGVMASLDRKLLAGLGDDEALRTVRVPATAAKWLTWKPYCDSTGISMGRAVTSLIDRELLTVFGDRAGDDPPVFAKQIADELVIREAKVAAREDRVGAAEQRLRVRDEELRHRESVFEARGQRVDLALQLASRPSLARVKVGRNERCSCGSGIKYKRCHGP